MTNNPLWDVIQEYMDDSSHRYPPKPADLARETGVTDQVISKWKQKATLPTAEQLVRFSRGTGIPFLDLLVAALRGKGYLPVGALQARFTPAMSRELLDALEREQKEGGEGNAGSTPSTSEPEKLKIVTDEVGQEKYPARSSGHLLPTAASKTSTEPSVNKRRRRQDEAAEENQDPGGMNPA